MSFKEFLEEKLITFNGKSYPKFGNVIILAGGGGCFEESTKVKLKDGSKSIIDVHENDEVLTINEDTQELEYKKVLKKLHHYAPNMKLVRVTLEDGQSFVCTEDHEFYIDQKWVKAKYLNNLNIVYIENTLDFVYDLHIEDNHNYVLESGLIAHNSGKDFQLQNLIGIEGKVLDVDKLKEIALRSDKFKERVKDELGKDLSEFDLKNPDDVGTLHDIIGSFYKLPKKELNALYSSILTASKERLPNLIFNVTLKDIGKLDGICRNVKKLGYEKDKIHLVWILNDVSVAIEQNDKRERRVPKDILVSTHDGASNTMNSIITKVIDVQNYLDGEIYISFNKVKIDTEVVFSTKGGKYIKDANYIKVKSTNKPTLTLDDIDQQLLKKIQSYVPKRNSWV